MLNFKPIESKDKELIDSFVKTQEYLICEYSFVYLYIWKDLLKFEIYAEGSVLYIRGFRNGLYLYLLPVTKDGAGPMDEYYMNVEEYAVSKKQNWALVCAEKTGMAKFTEEFLNKYEFRINSKFSDYIYKAEDLIKLPGKKYHKKRTHLSNFKSDYNYEFLPLLKKDFSECLSFYDKWKEEKPESMDEDLYEEFRALKIAFDNFDELGLAGACIRIDGKIEGFTVGEYKNDISVTIHFEKCNTEFEGIYAAINQMFAERYFSNMVYINREDDMGLEGLRKAKMSYYPCMMGEKYNIVRRKS